MQKREYMSFARTREYDVIAKMGYVHPKKWSPENLDATLNKYGADGWELVAVTSRADFGASNDVNSGLTNLTGATTTEVFLFKRPKG